MPSTHSYRLSTVCLLLCCLAAANAPAHEIHEAARAGDLPRVETLLAADPSLASLADERDSRPVHFAADGGHVPVLEVLVASGADLTVIDLDGDTPLHWAAYAGQIDAMGWLLAQGADLEARNHHEATPLLYTAKRRQHAAAEFLLDAGADTEAANDYGRTPLLWVARETNDIPMARLLLEQGADVNVVDNGGETALSLAAWRGFRVLVDLLLEAGADLHTGDELGGVMLGFAAEKGLDRLYGDLVRAGVAVPPGAATGRTFLHTAAVGGSETIVKDLLERGFAVDALDSFGWTPLHHAADKGRTGVVSTLLAAGAAPRLRTLSGFTARNLAERAGATTTAALLDDHGPRRFPALSGPYFGQGAAPAQPQVFAADIVSTPHGGHSSITFTPDGREAYWSMHIGRPDSGYTRGTIYASRIVDGRWTAPAEADFAAEWGDDVPFVTPDGQRLFFISRRPLEAGGAGGGETIWVCDRAGEDWGAPRPLTREVNNMPQHWQFSVAANGDLYFASRRGGAETQGLYVSRPVDGRYTTPEFLGFQGSAPFIAPDGSYLLTCEFGRTGLHDLVRFRNEDGSWSEPVDLTVTVDEAISGMCPMVSHDGRKLFFMKHHDGAHVIWWMDTGFLEALGGD